MRQAEKAMGGASGPDPEKGYPNADYPTVRQRVADTMLQCRDKALKAADHLEKALQLAN